MHLSHQLKQPGEPRENAPCPLLSWAFREKHPTLSFQQWPSSHPLTYLKSFSGCQWLFNFQVSDSLDQTGNSPGLWWPSPHYTAGESGRVTWAVSTTHCGLILTSLAHVDDLKPNVFTLSVTVGPDHQGLALPGLLAPEFSECPVGIRG